MGGTWPGRDRGAHRQREVTRQVEEAKPLYILWGGALSTSENLPPGTGRHVFDATLETLVRASLKRLVR